MKWTDEVYQKALIFAINAHKNQKIKGKDYPYIVHIITVYTEVILTILKSKIKKPDFAIQCALLHDTIENTSIQTA
jgi:(p)ppGpp synthase/HD superfamily hydrolase